MVYELISGIKQGRSPQGSELFLRLFIAKIGCAERTSRGIVAAGSVTGCPAWACRWSVAGAWNGRPGAEPSPLTSQLAFLNGWERPGCLG